MNLPEATTTLAVFGAVCLCISVMGYILEAKKSPQERWKDEQLALGRRPQDVDDEAAVRMCLAELRRSASDSAIIGDDWRITVEAVLENQSAELTRRAPRLGKRYLDLVAGLDDTDILTPEAHKIAFPPKADDDMKLIITDDMRKYAEGLIERDEHAAFGK